MPKFAESFRSRGYRHFDDPINFGAAKRLATSPHLVATHSFHPLIKRELKVLKYSKINNQTKEKIREIYYASHADSAVFGWYSAILNEKYEEVLATTPYRNSPVAYRKFPGQKCNIHFAKEAFDFIQKNRPCRVICMDIRGFFDNMSHELILDSWKGLFGFARMPEDHWKTYVNLTSFCWIVEKEITEEYGATRSGRKSSQVRRSQRKSKRKGVRSKFKPPVRFCGPLNFRLLRSRGLIQLHAKNFGIPQGTPISAVISNIYMMKFDEEVFSYVKSIGGMYRRYSDDIIVVVPESARDEVEFRLQRAIHGRRLEIQPEKTVSVHIPKIGKCRDNPIQYLGFTFDGEFIRLRCQTLKRANGRVKRYLRGSSKASSKNISNPRPYSNKFYARFSSRGDKNFIAYGKRCLRVIDSSKLVDQVIRHEKRNIRLLLKHRRHG